MRSGTRMLPTVGPLAALGRLVAAITAAGRCRSGQRRDGSPGHAGAGPASGLLMGKDER
jgi:hypothetical protein